MSSTEQKNITQPFIDACKTHGVLAVLCAGVLCDFPLETDGLPFQELGRTPNLLRRALDDSDPVRVVRNLIPALDGVRHFSRSSPLILKMASETQVVAGNQAVMLLYHHQLRAQGHMSLKESPAIRHAQRYTARLCGYLSSGAYGNPARAESNVKYVSRHGEEYRLKVAADVFAHLNASRAHHKHSRELRQWCSAARRDLQIGTSYYRTSRALEVYRGISEHKIRKLPEIPCLKLSGLRNSKHATITYKIRYYNGHYYIEVIQKYHQRGDFRLTQCDQATQTRRQRYQVRATSTTCILSSRDIDDLVYLLNAASATKLYLRRRVYDAREGYRDINVRSVYDDLWNQYCAVVKGCAMTWRLRNKLGVYFDVLQWRYLAYLSNDTFYNHSMIMAAKIESKGLTELPDQSAMLEKLKNLPVDMAIDLLGIYKASIYPEVDPYKVVIDQRNLHMSRHQTDWEPGSAEHERFQETKAYMWFLGIRVLHNRFKLWPGRIREGVEPQIWHTSYKTNGIPAASWRQAHDVDLTNAVPVQDITDEQYMRQQDSACAPPHPHEYTNFKAMTTAPRKHKRKILYTVQEHDPPDLFKVMSTLNEVGSHLPEGFVDKLDVELPFSTDIVTGSRCERHKDAPRPFYAASSPWGCILSYVDGITRDYLSHVPQSMLGKSTRQKYTDLQSASSTRLDQDYTFYMSDDKAKYSPRMDPASQQLPADFFAEVFGLPGIKTCGPLMYHNELYYRVNGHLVHYNSNGTDREGMRGSANTWLEIVAQGLSTRLCRDRNLVKDQSQFLSFIDDGLRKFAIQTRDRTPQQCDEAAREVIQDVIFGLRVLGRELSWDKTFISRDLYVMLNEINYKKVFMSSGLKSFCTIGDIEMREVMTAPDYEQLYFGKMRGAFGVGCPLDVCHYAYVFEVLMAHYKMGIDFQDKPRFCPLDYRLFCITPVALGGAGIRSAFQLSCNEVADATKEGIGHLLRLAVDLPDLNVCVQAILNQEMEKIDPLDFMREPEQFHVPNPRLKTQRLAAEVRKSVSSLASNRISNKYVELDELGRSVLRMQGELLMRLGDVSAEEIRLYYASSPVAFVDNFIQKLVSSSTVSELLGKDCVRRMRNTVRRDLIQAMEAFPTRCRSREVYCDLRLTAGKLARHIDFLIR